MKTKYLIIISILFSFQSCSIQQYYFHINEFENYKVYKYELKYYDDNELTTDPKYMIYWKIKSDFSSNTLNIDVYNSRFELTQSSKEKITSQGSELIEIKTYQYDADKLKTFNWNILECDVYKWNKLGNYSTSIQSNELIVVDEMLIEKTKTGYLGKENCNFLNSEYNAIKLKVNEKSEFSLEGELMKNERTKIYYYLKGFGLVKVLMKETKHYGEQYLELTEIIDEDQWVEISR